ncbi:MAG: 7-cyano-7-deazaguanine synthase [Planctomycetota bacterium]
MKRALVLVSGGIDSAVALWWARERYRVTALSFEGPSRPRGERRACARIVRRAGVPHLTVPAPYLRPHPSGYVPARNLVFHGIALSIAEDRGMEAVVAGHNRSDARIFRDARPEFFRRLERLAGRVRIELPLASFTDAQVVALGLRWGVPLELTWSCYRDGARPCGRCSACRDRLESLRAAGSEDPHESRRARALR